MQNRFDLRKEHDKLELILRIQIRFAS